MILFSQKIHIVLIPNRNIHWLRIPPFTIYAPVRACIEYTNNFLSIFRIANPTNKNRQLAYSSQFKNLIIPTERIINNSRQSHHHVRPPAITLIILTNHQSIRQRRWFQDQGADFPEEIEINTPPHIIVSYGVCSDLSAHLLVCDSHHASLGWTIQQRTSPRDCWESHSIEFFYPPQK